MKYRVMYQISNVVREKYRYLFEEREISIHELNETHKLVATIDAANLNEVFRIMNSYEENPLSIENGEHGQEIAREVGHTSMSINDVVIGEDNVAYRIAMFGFDPL